MSVKQLLVTLLLCGLYMGNASAIPVVVDANDYAPGTDITNAIDHVTLQQYIHAAGANSISYSHAITSNIGGTLELPTPIYILGAGIDGMDYDSDCGNLSCGYYMSVLKGTRSLSDTPDFYGLSITSDQAINNFELSDISTITIPGSLFTLELFDQNDNYISSIIEQFNIVSTCDGKPCFLGAYNFDLTGYSESVYRIAWSGLYDVASLRSFAINVPEPPGLALLGLGLLGLLFRTRIKGKGCNS